MARRHSILAAAGLALAGCSPGQQVNPSFRVTIARARSILTYDAHHPKPLRRPVLVVGGFLDPGWAAPRLRDSIRKWTGDARVAAVSLGLDRSMDECKQDILAAADAAFPSVDPAQTTVVDVVGVSMGGLAARYAALPSSHRLRIGRLFTISSPLRGAILADAVPFDLHPMLPALRSGSPLYHEVDDAPQRPDDLYPVYSYVRLNDGTVGAANAAVPGTTPWWVATPAGEFPHDAAYTDARILADIACRLRGDPPLAHDPPAPLPERS